MGRQKAGFGRHATIAWVLLAPMRDMW